MKNIFLGCCLLLIFACNSYCKKKSIPVGLISAHEGDKVSIYIEDKLVTQRDIKRSFIGRFSEKQYLLTEVCVEKDSVLLKAVFNSKDTSFYLNPAIINECYIGANFQNNIVVFYNYVEGGYREYSPVR